MGWYSWYTLYSRCTVPLVNSLPRDAMAMMNTIASGILAAPATVTSPHTRPAFACYRWPADVILTAVRWYAGYPLSATHVMQLLAERHSDVSARTVLN
jgi:hypothetical protein